MSLGWLASYEVWRSFNPDTSTDPDVDSLANFLLDDETAVGNIALGIGYVSIWFIAISYLFMVNFYLKIGNKFIHCLGCTESVRKPNQQQ